MDSQETKKPTKEERMVFEEYKRCAQSRGYAPLFIFFGVPLGIGLLFFLFTLFSFGNARQAFLGIAFIFLIIGLFKLVLAIILAGRHSIAKRYVVDWYERYPEERPDRNRVNVTVQISMADEIRELKKLLDEGIITQEEFEAKKQQLLK